MGAFSESVILRQEPCPRRLYLHLMRASAMAWKCCRSFLSAGHPMCDAQLFIFFPSPHGLPFSARRSRHGRGPKNSWVSRNMERGLICSRRFTALSPRLCAGGACFSTGGISDYWEKSLYLRRRSALSALGAPRHPKLGEIPPASGAGTQGAAIADDTPKPAGSRPVIVSQR